MPDGDYGSAEEALIADLADRVASYTAHWEAIEIRKAAAELRAIWVVGNEYLQAQQPWAVAKEDMARAGAIVRAGLNLVRLYGLLSQPFIPDAADKVLTAMGVGERSWPGNIAAELQALPPGHDFSVPDNLFDKISDDAREGMQAQFAGK